MRIEHPTYCPRCGGRLESNLPGPHGRCLACGEVFYRNPAIGVAVIVLDADSILLGRRGRGAYAGRWCIPCGYVEWGEDIRVAARREVEEETGLVVEVGEIYAAHSNFHDRERLTVGIWFRGRVVGGALSAGDDLDAVDYFAVDAPPDLAFPTDAAVIASLASKRPS